MKVTWALSPLTCNHPIQVKTFVRGALVHYTTMSGLDSGGNGTARYLTPACLSYLALVRLNRAINQG